MGYRGEQYMKAVFAVGIRLPGSVAKYIQYSSDSSLLDADIIIIRPKLPDDPSYYVQSYKGKPRYGEYASFAVKKQIAHWRRELRSAVDSGKTVFVMLGDKDEVFIDSGERTYSGTGKNARTTIHVDPCCNYDVLPFELEITPATGQVMTLSDKAAILRPYWREFGERSIYKVIINCGFSVPLVLSKDRKHVLGAIMRLKGSAGNFVLLPNISFSKSRRSTGEKQSMSRRTKNATILGQQFIQFIHDIDETLQSQSARMAIPAWANNPIFDLPAERKINEQILRLELRSKDLQREEFDLRQQLNEETLLKGLLYEQGHGLESAIIQALKLLGFTASRLKESGSEFDVVFISAEGRFIGEAEGKDSKAINIDKLRQLQMNIHEDFERNNENVMAKPVLFGNAARLIAPEERGEFFTEKCITAAKSMRCALVRTPDLFHVIRHLSDSPDSEFARQCREAILSTSGEIVIFPSVPMLEGQDQIRD